MCLIVIGWRTHPAYPLVVAANRDEFHERPTAPATFWDNPPGILAGRDLEAGGTWLGIAENGRFAALTNYRDPRHLVPGSPSRGRLVSDFLAGQQPAGEYLAALAAEGARYNGFNLFVADGERLAYYSNRDGTARELPPGIYGLSNHLLDTPWPKLTAARSAFADALPQLPGTAPLFALLADDEIAADQHLPETGVPLEWERLLSSIFVRSPRYGTRASTAVVVGSDGWVSFEEKSFGPEGEVTGTVTHRFRIDPARAQASTISTGV